VTVERSSPVVSWLIAATTSPSGSARRKARPYSRIDSATSWPTVRSAGGSGGGRGRSGPFAARAIAGGYSATAARSLGSASASASSDLPIRQRERSPSASSFEIARSSTAGIPARSQARSTPNPSIASTRSV
jgi:hypothetical protein